MLGKLIKYEWKSVSKVGLLFLAGTVIATLMGWLSFKTPMWAQALGGASEEISPFSIFDLFGIVGLLFYVVCLVGISLGMMVYLGIHFYRSMYTNQGYLAHTLPVTPHQLLFSKVLVGGLWSIITTVMVALSVLALMGSLLTTALHANFPGMSMMEIIDRLMESFYDIEMIIAGLEEGLGMSLPVYILFLVTTVVLGGFYTISQLYGAITIGQLSNKHKVLMSIVAYVVVGIINSVISSMVTFSTMLFQVIRENNSLIENESSLVIGGTNILTLVQGILMGVILYFVAHYIITKKLNLE